MVPSTFVRPVRIGTRASALALWQAEWVAARMQEIGAAVELVRMTTRGDVQSGELRTLGGQGAFTKEIQLALLEGAIDVAVHSLKDLPTEPVAGLALAAVPARERVADALIARRPGMSFARLPSGSRVGTDSLRRRAQLWHFRPDLRMVSLRGNVDTRLRKLESGEYDAIVLAEAGLRRLGLESHITETLPLALSLPAIGQGALGIEVRAGDAAAEAVAARLNDPPTQAAVICERAMLHELRAGCLAPVGGWAEHRGQRLTLTAAVLSPDGRERIASAASVQIGECARAGALLTEEQARRAAELGEHLARRLIEAGADRFIAASRAAV